MSELTIPLPIIQTSVVLINALSITLLILINSKKVEKRISRMFSAMIALMLIWVNFAFLARITDPTRGVVFIRFAWSITPLFFAIIYFFITELFSLGDKFTHLKKTLLTLGVVNVPFIILTSLVIQDIWFTAEGVVDIEYGGWEWLFFSQVILISCLIIYRLVRQLVDEDEKRSKDRVKYLLVGFSFFLVMNAIFNIALPVFLEVFNLYAFGDYSTIIFLALIAYAITRKELFDIKGVLSTMAIGLISILLLIDLVVFTADILWIRVIKVVILAGFLLFGIILVKSVTKEVERREELEELSDQLVETNIKLKKANKKLKKLDKAKSEFISIASHQLRTPLTAIKGYLSMIMEGSYGEISEDAEDKIGDVLGSSERLISLVNDLLNVSRIESGKIEMNFEDVKIFEFIKESIKELKIVAEKEDLYLELNSEVDKNQLVEIDQSRMRQVILNIIDNAIKYTEEGGIAINLKNQKLQSGLDSVLIEISDTGEGMTEEEVKNIFESFSRGSAGDLMHAEGAGLGLYIAKKFVDMHNGSIWIESDGKGEGASFFMELPVEQV